MSSRFLDSSASAMPSSPLLPRLIIDLTEESEEEDRLSLWFGSDTSSDDEEEGPSLSSIAPLQTRVNTVWGCSCGHCIVPGQPSDEPLMLAIDSSTSGNEVSYSGVGLASAYVQMESAGFHGYDGDSGEQVWRGGDAVLINNSDGRDGGGGDSGIHNVAEATGNHGGGGGDGALRADGNSGGSYLAAFRDDGGDGASVFSVHAAEVGGCDGGGSGNLPDWYAREGSSDGDVHMCGCGEFHCSCCDSVRNSSIVSDSSSECGSNSDSGSECGSISSEEEEICGAPTRDGVQCINTVHCAWVSHQHWRLLSGHGCAVADVTACPHHPQILLVSCTACAELYSTARARLSGTRSRPVVLPYPEWVGLHAMLE